MKSKNIAIVVTDLGGNGAEKSVLNRAKILFENGHNVVLFLIENVKIYDVDNYKFPIIALTKRRDTFKFLGKIGDYIYAKILESKMKQFEKFDIIFSHLPRADRVVKLIKHPNKYFVIHMSYKAELEKFSERRAAKKLKLYRYLYEGEKIITVSKAMIKDFDELDIRYKFAEVIYNPFDIDEIRQKGNDPIELDYDYIISSSAFKKQKRYDVLLDAFKLIKHNIKLVILATPHPKLISMIKERGLEKKVIILGFQQNPYKYIKNAKLLVLASDREGLPRVVVESLSLGTPVVSTDCPTGPAEVLVDKLSRWLVLMDNPKLLAQKIDEALDENIKIEDHIVEKFGKQNIYKKLEQLLKENI